MMSTCVHAYGSCTESLPPTFIMHPCPSLILPGAEFHAGLVVSEEVEAHRAGLHLLPARREHEETQPDCLQHGGGRDRVRTPALSPRSASGPHVPSRCMCSQVVLISGPSGVISYKSRTPPKNNDEPNMYVNIQIFFFCFVSGSSITLFGFILC